MTEVSVGNKRHEKRPRKQRTRRDLLVPGFTEFKALLLFHKQHYKYFAITMQHSPVSFMNLSVWFILTHNTKVWDHRSPSPSIRFGNVNTCPNSALFLISHWLGCCFCVTGWFCVTYAWSQTHICSGRTSTYLARITPDCRFKGFKGFLCLFIIGLKLRSHTHLSTLSGSVQEVRYKNWPLYSEAERVLRKPCKIM